ncbi:hypothetical protein [Synechococcus sp. PCC 6312]|uniref:hypothetical protein n=1 Tax=Synechococcus sp. (strain ATCC 27167 / PCC 6312) TaxID=195253 RepID=UPI00030472A8|nr:hypothetical protein [Synechococcus sp. PCC 6312]
MVIRNDGIIGEGVGLTIKDLENIRQNTVVYELTKHSLYNKFRYPGDEPKLFFVWTTEADCPGLD